MREKMNLTRIILAVIFGSVFTIGIGILLNSDDIVLARIRPKLIEIEIIQEQRSIEESTKSNNKTISFEEEYKEY